MLLKVTGSLAVGGKAPEQKVRNIKSIYSLYSRVSFPVKAMDANQEYCETGNIYDLACTPL